MPGPYLQPALTPRIYINGSDFAIGDASASGTDRDVSDGFGVPTAKCSFWLKIDGAVYKMTSQFYSGVSITSGGHSFGDPDFTSSEFDTSFVVACSGTAISGGCSGGFTGIGAGDVTARPYTIPCNTAAVQLVPFLDATPTGTYGHLVQMGFFIFNNTTAAKSFEVAVVIDLGYAGDDAAGIKDDTDAEYDTATWWASVNAPGVPGTPGWFRVFSDVAVLIQSQGISVGGTTSVVSATDVALVETSDANTDPFGAIDNIIPGSALSDTALVLRWIGSAASGSNPGMSAQCWEGQTGFPGVDDDWQVDVLPL